MEDYPACKESGGRFAIAQFALKRLYFGSKVVVYLNEQQLTTGHNSQLRVAGRVRQIAVQTPPKRGGLRHPQIS
ncbi:MAG: hypothetical protein ACLUQH_11025 [Collinsella sp.]